MNAFGIARDHEGIVVDSFGRRDRTTRDLEAEIIQLLLKTTRFLPRPYVARGTNVTEAFLAEIGDTVSAPNRRMRVGLERLSRKVDVAKAVWRSYDEGWRAPTDRTPISGEAWDALIAAFLHRALSPSAPDPLARTGESLRFLNSAYNAFGVRKSVGQENTAVLKQYADLVLARTLADSSLS